VLDGEGGVAGEGAAGGVQIETLVVLPAEHRIEVVADGAALWVPR